VAVKDSIAQCIIALQDGGLATVATEMALLITSAQNLCTRVYWKYKPQTASIVQGDGK